ncbi:MAG: single-stranded-DNA-specific exonuclease RecJ [Candidatus Dormibacteraeota bacterium]|nr:single-stranded-DNA-specific exonuclease RecJ [Candidatus Dormibacteraeota bacterium]
MRPAPRRWQASGCAPLPGFDPVLGRVLAARGYDASRAARLIDSAGECHDPLLLPAMPNAVSVIREAVRDGTPIAVYGDYDADGVTACAMLTRALRSAGARVVPYIPNRMTEGYGLHRAALEELGARGVGCVITVDCGTSSVDVAASRPAGMRLIVTDHHLPLAPDGGPPRLADVDALINPKLEGSEYPFDGLAGAGVAFKLLQALEEAGIVPEGAVRDASGLAALGTVADLMPLRGENRSIVREGLPRLRDVLGVQSLCDVAGLDGDLRASDLAFAIGPRINAAGRMEDARLALQLCLVTDEDEGLRLAQQLDAQNRERQAAVAAAVAQAEERVAELDEDAPAIVLGDPEWPMGIVGLVAGRLAERYARPAFVVCLDAAEAKGSARSVAGVHIVRALDRAAPALLRYGGHTAAAGFSLEASRFAEFRVLITDAVAAQLDSTPRERVFAIDSEITAGGATPALCRELERLEPCGLGNLQPLLALRGARVLSTTTFGADKQHLRVVLAAGGGMVEAIAFHKPQLQRHLPRGREIDACFSLEMDSWQGQLRVRARLRDLQPAAQPIAPALSFAATA